MKIIIYCRQGGVMDIVFLWTGFFIWFVGGVLGLWIFCIYLYLVSKNLLIAASKYCFLRYHNAVPHPIKTPFKLFRSCFTRPYAEFEWVTTKLTSKKWRGRGDWDR